MAHFDRELNEDLFQAVHRPFQSLPDALDTLLRAFAQRTPIQGASLSARRVGTLVLDRAGRQITTDWLNEIGLGASSEIPGEVDADEASVDDAVRDAEWWGLPVEYSCSAAPATKGPWRSRRYMLTINGVWPGLPCRDNRSSTRGCS